MHSYHITFSPLGLQRLPILLVINPKVSHYGLVPSPVWSGPCLSLSDLIFYHIPPCSRGSRRIGLAVLWTDESFSCFRAFTLSLLPACSALSVDICTDHASPFRSQLKCHLYRYRSPRLLPELPPRAPILSLSERYRIHLVIYLFIVIVACFLLKNKSIRNVRTLFSPYSTFCFSSFHYKIIFSSPLWFLLITSFTPILISLLFLPTSPI